MLESNNSAAGPDNMELVVATNGTPESPPESSKANGGKQSKKSLDERKTPTS